MLDRRRLLALGGLTAGGAVVGGAVVGGGLLVPSATSAPGHAGHGQAHTPVAATRPIRPETLFSQRMPVPQQLVPVRRRDGVDVYHVPIQAAEHKFRAGGASAVRTYGGQFVGPTLRAKTGRPVEVTFTNRLDVHSNVHLHGGHVTPENDGHPMDTIAPGASRTYRYANNQQGATLWYHDHAHHVEAENVYKGLHGFYIIDDDAESHLRLPSGPYDVPILLREVELDANGALVYPPGTALEAQSITANGVVTPHFPVAARKYRFRLLNGGVERVFRLTMGRAQMVQIGSDGGLLPAPVPRSEIVLGSAERVDIVVDFSALPVGSHVVLYDVTGPVLRFDVTRTAADHSRVPATLRPLPALGAATVERDVAMRFDLTGPEVLGLINDQVFDPNRVDLRIKRGTTEIWRVRNDDVEFAIPHTFHMHLEQFRVLDRDGRPPDPDDLGRKDTVFVGPGETVRLQVTFTEHVGKYMYHCHYLWHSAVGMMAQMEIVP